MVHPLAMPAGARVHVHAAPSVRRFFVVSALAFLTLVDLFAAQAILPVLAQAYRVSPAIMGVAVNASTFGMAAAGLGMSLFGGRIDRQRGIVVSLALLSIPTALLSVAPGPGIFALLRVIQGVFMCSAFSLTLTYLGEACSPAESAGAFATYITGNVLSNLIGRLIAAGLVTHFGLAFNFRMFAVLNLCGAMLAACSLGGAMRTPASAVSAPIAAWTAHVRNPALRPALGIGFCILFAFIGVFTYINFVLVRPPLNLGMMQVGLSYIAFLPSVVTTPVAGPAVRVWGTRPVLWASLAIAGFGLVLLLASKLSLVVSGMVLVACGTFCAQAVATAYVGKTAQQARGAASGLYLAAYFAGGLAGSYVLGQLFDRAGWIACVAGVGASLVAAALLTAFLQSEGKNHA